MPLKHAERRHLSVCPRAKWGSAAQSPYLQCQANPLAGWPTGWERYMQPEQNIPLLNFVRHLVTDMLFCDLGSREHRGVTLKRSLCQPLFIALAIPPQKEPNSPGTKCTMY